MEHRKLKKISELFKNTAKQPSFEDNPNLKKLSLFIVIIGYGQGDAVVKLFKELGSSIQFIQLGEGTANNQVLEILNISEIRKEIIYAFVKDEDIANVRMELEAFFMANKKNRGIAFTISLKSLMGVNVYKVLTDSKI